MASRLSLDPSLIEKLLRLFVSSVVFYTFIGERSVWDQELQTLLHGEAASQPFSVLSVAATSTSA